MFSILDTVQTIHNLGQGMELDQLINCTLKYIFNTLNVDKLINKEALLEYGLKLSCLFQQAKIKL